MASYVCENLGLEAELADSLAVLAGLLGSSGRGEFNVVDTEGIESLGTVGKSASAHSMSVVV